MRSSIRSMKKLVVFPLAMLGLAACGPEASDFITIERPSVIIRGVEADVIIRGIAKVAPSVIIRDPAQQGESQSVTLQSIMDEDGNPMFVVSGLDPSVIIRGVSAEATGDIKCITAPDDGSVTPQVMCLVQQ